LKTKNQKGESIVKILKDEHNLVRENFKKILEGNNPMTDIYSQTADAILNHFLGEEKLVFPKFESNPETRRLTHELIEEHALARKTIKELSSPSTSDNEKWFAKVKVLNDMLDNHFKLEEDDVFPKVGNMLSDKEQKDIGKQYKNKQF
jgi:hemerythrin superfamily protein